ncbi:hypothetical protein W02_34490 [Nitrospira sp. KM1]|uniref:HEAT repeat domain-containing protein n=1 Tax=Nitrospira sp. KM1 TaxID=1936990 RepID=UPI0013A781E8|nr:HEAT repeat domain-containing protein [Nitrospira sp. KM1]BCA56309.1 hypothetical protein W02_34490 [Nitrospira sp. KM1]
MTLKAVYLNLGGLGLLAALLGWIYWQHTGSRAVPALIEDLHGNDLQAQLLAVHWLGTLGDDARPAVPALVEQALHHRDANLNAAAANALRFLDLASARAVMQSYLPALADPREEVRRNACAVLGRLGLLAKPAIPSLIGMLGDTDDTVRERAVAAIGAIGLPSVDVATALTTALFDKAPMVRFQAASHFAFTVPIPASAVAPLNRLKQDSDRSVASQARIALDRGGGIDRTDVQLLIAQLRTLDERDGALHRLARLGPLASDAVGVLADILRDPLPLHRYLAATTLGEIGPDAKDSLPGLEQASHDTDPIVREAAAHALNTVGGVRR